MVSDHELQRERDSVLVRNEPLSLSLTMRFASRIPLADHELLDEITNALQQRSSSKRCARKLVAMFCARSRWCSAVSLAAFRWESPAGVPYAPGSPHVKFCQQKTC